MNKVHKRRLIWVCVLLSCSILAVLLIMQALRENINLFFTPTQVTQGEAPQGILIRVGGMVEKNSVKRGNHLQVQFVVTDFSNKLIIHYSGILPDLFREGQGIVALGRLTSNNQFLASEVLAKHDENYMPPEIRSSLNLVKKPPKKDRNTDDT
jgi:cytochrome c-type biogenesis protein CcmE